MICFYKKISKRLI